MPHETSIEDGCPSNTPLTVDNCTVTLCRRLRVERHFKRLDGITQADSSPRALKCKHEWMRAQNRQSLGDMTSFVKRITGTKAGKGAWLLSSRLRQSGLAPRCPVRPTRRTGRTAVGATGTAPRVTPTATTPSARPAGIGYQIAYDCNVELDEWHTRSPGRGFEGKMSTWECTFKINGTRIHQHQLFSAVDPRQ